MQHASRSSPPYRTERNHRLGGQRSDCGTIEPRRARAHQHERPLGLLEHFGEAVAAGSDIGERVRPGAEIVIS
jgi:hypothetical protein